MRMNLLPTNLLPLAIFPLLIHPYYQEFLLEILLEYHLFQFIHIGCSSTPRQIYYFFLMTALQILESTIIPSLSLLFSTVNPPSSLKLFPVGLVFQSFDQCSSSSEHQFGCIFSKVSYPELVIVLQMESDQRRIEHCLSCFYILNDVKVSWMTWEIGMKKI